MAGRAVPCRSRWCSTGSAAPAPPGCTRSPRPGCPSSSHSAVPAVADRRATPVATTSQPFGRPRAAIGEDGPVRELEGAVAAESPVRKPHRVELVTGDCDGFGAGDEARLVEVVDRHVDETAGSPCLAESARGAGPCSSRSSGASGLGADPTSGDAVAQRRGSRARSAGSASRRTSPGRGRRRRTSAWASSSVSRAASRRGRGSRARAPSRRPAGASSGGVRLTTMSGAVASTARPRAGRKIGALHAVAGAPAAGRSASAGYGDERRSRPRPGRSPRGGSQNREIDRRGRRRPPRATSPARTSPSATRCDVDGVPGRHVPARRPGDGVRDHAPDVRVVVDRVRLVARAEVEDPPLPRAGSSSRCGTPRRR